MRELQITGIDIFRGTIPLVAPFEIALGVIAEADHLFVRIRTDDDLVGWGETTPLPQITGDTSGISAAAATTLAGLLLGTNPLDIESRITDLSLALAFNSSLRSAFDMALYDVAARVAGLPLYALLGGGSRPLQTDVTIGLEEPEVMAEQAAELQQEGVPAIKVKLGTTAAEDAERIESIRASIGDGMPLRIDANQGWDFPTAVAVLRRLESSGIEYCEQPIAHWDFDGLRRLRSRVTIPIMADESVFDHHDAFRLTAAGCCDYLNIKLAKSGGIHTALKINAIAEAHVGMYDGNSAGVDRGRAPRLGATEHPVCRSRWSPPARRGSGRRRRPVDRRHDRAFRRTGSRCLDRSRVPGGMRANNDFVMFAPNRAVLVSTVTSTFRAGSRDFGEGSR